MGDIKWFLGFLVVIGILWLGSRVNNGNEPAQQDPEPSAQTVGALLPGQPNPAAGNPAGKQRAYPTAGTGISGGAVAQTPLNLSPLRGKLFIKAVQKTGPVEREYVLIQAAQNNTDAVPITGLTLRSGVNLTGGTIGRGWTLFFPGSAGEGDTVLLKPGARAYILSASAPLAPTSESPPGRGGLQLNKCTGYFARGRSLYPELPIECPHPTKDPLPLPPNNLSDACYDYMATLRRCTIPPSTMPTNLIADGSCQAHLFNKINYNQCVAYHKDDADFYRGEWRLYLGRSSELWRDRREAIELLDADGKLISSYSY